MIYTSCYAKAKSFPDSVVPVAISLQIPEFYSGMVYRLLAPTPDILHNYKLTHNQQEYRRNYRARVLDKLNADSVAQTLLNMAGGKDVALLCYEKSGDFCHRHLVASWLREYGIECKEF